MRGWSNSAGHTTPRRAVPTNPETDYPTSTRFAVLQNHILANRARDLITPLANDKTRLLQQAATSYKV